MKATRFVLTQAEMTFRVGNSPKELLQPSLLLQLAYNDAEAITVSIRVVIDRVVS